MMNGHTAVLGAKLSRINEAVKKSADGVVAVPPVWDTGDRLSVDVQGNSHFTNYAILSPTHTT